MRLLLVLSHFTQKSSVRPGYTVDSKITTSLILRNLEILRQTFFKGLKSGIFFLLTGVGTVTMNMLTSDKLLILLVILIFLIKFNCLAFNSLFESILFFNS